ncbi:oligopeptide ABC transporter permease [Clostridium tagluense]|uniref:oligopeptide ABC transporter permease n=1 Tax=Clostridium tagluense TaxID=360422 RepID=UPI001C0B5303|nr:oligopeptide ABC transporter permease [Clostridium tagluense]MBU3127955.1 ABC transporter permease [Clostridium tagluense]
MKINNKKFNLLLKNKRVVFAVIFLTVVVLISVFAPLLITVDRDQINTAISNTPPSLEHLLGTDDLGRDIFVRLIYGGRISLAVGMGATFISVTIGVILGATAGYFGGAIDMVIMVLLDIFMCLPFFIIAIILASLIGPSIWNSVIIIGFLGWTTIARIVRGEVLALKERQFIEAARCIGMDSIGIIFKHIIPNIISSIIVYATLGIAGAILAEAGLSYLGMGVKQPIPSWGNMLSTARNMRSLMLYWWEWAPPGVMVFLTILSINFMGDGLRNVIKPNAKE